MNKLFHMFEITPEVIANLQAVREGAHFHDFEELVIITHGGMKHWVDFQEELIMAPAVAYVSQGRMHRVEEFDDLSGWVLTYQNEFVPDSKIAFYSNFMPSASVALNAGTCMGRFDQLCRILHAEYLYENPDMKTIRFLLTALISMVETERQRQLPVDVNLKLSHVTSFDAFLRILEDNFRRPEGVGFYADKMNMSERNLNFICRSNFNKSVSEFIETRKLIEAKNMLIFSDKSVSEIGYELGYSEKSYFTRVFRNKILMTPTDYRDMIRRMLS